MSDGCGKFLFVTRFFSSFPGIIFRNTSFYYKKIDFHDEVQFLNPVAVKRLSKTTLKVATLKPCKLNKFNFLVAIDICFCTLTISE